MNIACRWNVGAGRLRAIVLSACFVFVLQAAIGQVITGSTSIDIDPNTGNVTVVCETDLDGDASAYYDASVTCTISGNGTLIGTKTTSKTQGYTGSASAAFLFAGAPGTTYTATGTHTGIIQFSDSLGYIDYYYFGYWQNNFQTYPGTWDWFGSGPSLDRPTKAIATGSTTITGIRYYTPSELSSLINSAQSIFSPHCNAVFFNVIGPTYNNINFFQSLLATSIFQYPKGATPPPDIGDTRNEPDADTLVTQPGRPIRIFANFYPNGSNSFDYPNFQQIVLIHEGLHHYTGWYDFPTAGQNDFRTKFYNSGYRNTSLRTNDFSIWLNAGCPPAS